MNSIRQRQSLSINTRMISLACWDGHARQWHFLIRSTMSACVNIVGRIKDAEFAIASGELSRPSFVEFLQQSLAAAAAVSRDGAIHTRRVGLPDPLRCWLVLVTELN
jgi:hypothetical protein